MLKKIIIVLFLLLIIPVVYSDDLKISLNDIQESKTTVIPITNLKSYLDINNSEKTFLDLQVSSYNDITTISPVEFRAEIFPDNSKYFGYKNLTISFEIYNEKIDKYISLVGNGLIPKYYGEEFNIDLKNANIVDIPYPIIWKYSIDYNTYDVNYTKIESPAIKSLDIDKRTPQTENITVYETKQRSYKFYNNLPKDTSSILGDFLYAKLDPNISACGALTTPNSIYTLNQSISSNNCLTVNASNVTIDCVGNWINFNTGSAGIAIQVINKSNINIMNCIFNETSSASSQVIDVQNVTNINISNSTFYIHASSTRGVSNAYGKLPVYNMNIFNNYFYISSGIGTSYIDIESGSSYNIYNNLFNYTSLGNLLILTSYTNTINVYNNTMQSSRQAFYLSNVYNVNIYNNSITSYSNNSIQIFFSSGLSYPINWNITGTVNGLPINVTTGLSNAIINNNNFLGTSDLIFINSNNLTISNNVIGESGLILLNGVNMNVSYNNISVKNYSIIIYGKNITDSNIISNNLVMNYTNTNNLISFLDSYRTNFTSNYIYLNKPTGYNIVYSNSSYNNAFYNNFTNNITSNYGIMFNTKLNANYNNISYNNINGYGYSFDIESLNNYITYNTINAIPPLITFYILSNNTYIANNVVNMVGLTSTNNICFYITSGNNTIINNNLTINGATSSSNHMLYLNGAKANKILYNNFLSNNSYVIYMDSSAYYNNISYNNIISPNYHAVYLTAINFSSFNNNNITSNLNTSIILINSGYNNFTSNYISSGTLDVNITATGTSFNNLLINDTFTKSKLKVNNDRSSLNIYWYLDIYVNDSVGPLNASIQGTNNTASLVFNVNTTNGWMPEQTLLEYWMNNVSTYYSTNYTINVSKNSSYTNQSYVLNLTSSRTLYFTLITSASNSCTWSGSGTWIIQGVDACVLLTNVNLLNNVLIFNGTGLTQVYANITNISLRINQNNSTVIRYNNSYFRRGS